MEKGWGTRVAYAESRALSVRAKSYEIGTNAFSQMYLRFLRLVLPMSVSERKTNFLGLIYLAHAMCQTFCENIYLEGRSIFYSSIVFLYYSNVLLFACVAYFFSGTLHVLPSFHFVRVVEGDLFGARYSTHNPVPPQVQRLLLRPWSNRQHSRVPLCYEQFW